MKNNVSLVVMAAGMGSRYGNLKQIDKIGNNGEILLDFSVFDAKKAGFSKVVFIIRRDIEKDFREITKNRIEKMIDVEYAFQDMDLVPSGFSVPNGRVKPWGTGHAIYCLKDAINTPFAVINADDYYGKASYRVIYNELSSGDNSCMVGFKLGNTLTENGTVSRGICEIENGFLKSITEHTALTKDSDIPLDTIVSMNMWGFTPSIFEYIERDFKCFLSGIKNPEKDEFYLPFVVDNMIKNDNSKIKVLESNEKWYGMTYHADKQLVSDAMNKKVLEGEYDGI